MSNSVNAKSNKSVKHSKSSSKSKPNIELSCKFRGKYDLNKKKNDKEINLENAVNLFEVIHKKNKNLFRDTSIKMYKDKKVFSFGVKKGISKIHHKVPYIQVHKFFVLQKDPTMVIMGVNHKSHKWFLVFQFHNNEDLANFCDEIEGEKKNEMNHDAGVVSQNITEVEPEDNKENSYDNPNDIEKVFIESEMLNTTERTEVNFDESFYDPELNNLNNNTLDRENVSFCSTRLSSRSSSNSEFNNRVHCDDLSKSRLKDLLVKSGSQMYLDCIDWEENLHCLNYPQYKDSLENSRNGPIYMYCAQFKNKDSKLIIDDSMSIFSNDYQPGLSNTFCHFEPKFLGNDIENFNSYDPKILTDGTQSFYHYEPKLMRDDSLNFNHNEIIPGRHNSEDYTHYEPKLINKNELSSFEHFTPKLISTRN